MQNIILSRVREYMIYDAFSDKEYLDLGLGGGRIQRAQKQYLYLALLTLSGRAGEKAG